MKNEKDLNGIGGWLIIPIIGMIITIGMLFFEALDMFSYYSYDYEIASFIMIIDFAIIAIAGLALYNIFNHNKLGKTMAIIFYIFIAIVNLFSIEFAMVIGNIIWLLYFIKSKRVKQTLIN